MKITNAQSLALLGIAGFAMGYGDPGTAMLAIAILWIAKAPTPERGGEE